VSEGLLPIPYEEQEDNSAMTVQNQDLEGVQLRQFWAIWRGWVLLALFLLAVVIVLLVLGATDVIDTGFGEYKPDANVKPAPERAKTLWDWMDLLLVPLVLAIGAAFFTWVTDKRAREIEEDRIKEQRRIEEDRFRQAALQTYLDRVSALLRDRWRESGEGFLEANIIRAQTLTVLRQLDGERKGLLLKFLYESGLIGEPVEAGEEPKEAVIDLRGAILSGADLFKANLGGAILSGAILSGADLRLAKLLGTELLGAYLYEADLRGALLYDANLYKANLEGADLTGANLQEANLREVNSNNADLSDADLTGANLHRANVTDEQLAQAKSLEGATLPDGTMHE
jgi:hypothetical protein